MCSSPKTHPSNGISEPTHSEIQTNEDNGITYWRKGEPIQNFGDFLTTLFVSDLFADVIGSFCSVHLIGSTICNYVINQDLRNCDTLAQPHVAFWGCGMREERKLYPRFQSKCRFLGVRGPLTRRLLDLPETTAIGDPAFLVPLLYQPAIIPELASKVICIPHFYDSASDETLLHMTMAEHVVSPRIPCERLALLRMIDIIAGASFILAGSLHAAIVACAFGRPFAFFDSGLVDIPFKWRDFAFSVNVPTAFVRNIDEGRLAYRHLLEKPLRKPRLAPMLECAPFKLKPGMILKAEAYDAG